MGPDARVRISRAELVVHKLIAVDEQLLLGLVVGGLTFGSRAPLARLRRNWDSARRYDGGNLMSTARVKAPIGGLVTIVGALALSGCGGSVIDNGKLEKTIVQKNPGLQSASCPSGKDSKTGNTFDCTVTLRSGQTATAHVTVTDGSRGNVTFDISSASLRGTPTTPTSSGGTTSTP
jgi:hypothetical protein